MRRWLFLAIGVLALVAFPPTAHASGVSIRWNNCYSDGGTLNRTFACAANTGTNRMVMAFVSDHDITGVTGFEMYALVATASTSLPAWWQFTTVGSCRQSALSLGPSDPGTLLNCQDWSGGQAVGGIASYQVGTSGPNTARIQMVVAVALPVDLVAGQEYFLGTLNISNTKTVNTACTGCTTPAAVFFEGVNVTLGSNSNEYVTAPSNEPESQWVTWQNGVVTDVNRPACVAIPGQTICRLPLDTSYNVTNGLATRWLRSGAR